MKNIIVFIILSLASISATAQSPELITALLHRISQQQVQQDAFFLPGIFPSYISSKEVYNSTKKDNNIFYNALISFTLKNIKPYLSKNNKIIIDSIEQKARPLYAHFINQKGRNTYNFWRTDSAFEYPYTGLLNPFNKHVTLPDDMDDTVFSLWAQDVSDSAAAAIHTVMQDYTNNGTNELRSVLPTLNNYPAYSTWFGKKLPVIFDVSVLCNVLSFVQENKLTWTKADSASLELITKTITEGYYKNEAIYVSPYYGKTSIILYHIARLMAIKPIPALEALKKTLVTDAAIIWATTKNPVEKIMLSSALLKWGYKVPTFEIPTLTTLEQNDFAFFTGNIPSYFGNTLRRYATKKGLGLYYHYCPAYNDALLLEYLVLSNK